MSQLEVGGVTVPAQRPPVALVTVQDLETQTLQAGLLGYLRGQRTHLFEDDILPSLTYISIRDIGFQVSISCNITGTRFVNKVQSLTLTRQC